MLDLSLYKGSKRIRAEFEEGEYVMKIVAKHAVGQQNEAPFLVQFYEFQLYMVAADKISSLDEFPDTLNLLGMLGTEGKDYH